MSKAHTLCEALLMQAIPARLAEGQLRFGGAMHTFITNRAIVFLRRHLALGFARG